MPSAAAIDTTTATREPVYDLLVVGGGINGAGIARDAAGRELSVLLVEQDDLASYTSSSSTKLIHGGLRYLEYYEFRLVREALIERERLLGMAPHIIWPLRFVLPQSQSPRAAWMVRLGLFLYDHLGGRKQLPGTQTIDLDRAPQGKGLRATGSKGKGTDGKGTNGKGRAFVYSDCWVEDSRLVVLNAMDAAARGARIETRTRLTGAETRDGIWHATLEGPEGTREVRAKMLVNAAGPWVDTVLRKLGRARNDRGVRLVKGSHIVVPRLYEGDHAFMLQNPDRRIVFAIPYEREFTLIGTTDEPWTEAPGKAEISAAETDYLCETANRYFETAITPADVVWSYAGIRPLYDDHAANASAVTRDYVLDFDRPDEGAPMLSIFGGKITTFRKLAEHALQHIAEVFPEAGQAWTGGAVLPGGDLPGGDFAAYCADLQTRYPQFPTPHLARLARAYGTRAGTILGGATRIEDLGEDFGAGLTAREVDYLVEHEWARTPEDILYRRSKLGLHVPQGAAQALARYLAKAPAGN
ncbi:glycerol-3-phosphate dehydrogenase [Novosphingobium profundi]|uniref:glycerol-3-phosphate dehydrogenase n=1 Tax=Novosphingobium profundi TaxID=1774954 RepID=UPI001BDB0ED8|nr:glycerol-3-phosphate dehydrogenase [Novosphingobium profundi]MBT0669825.1 glycerol-3-phosphate dehydrogenase [Novosphingobium profundi]